MYNYLHQIQLLFISLLLLSGSILQAQSIPQGFNYQTIIRDQDSGQPLSNSAVTLSFIVRTQTSNGSTVYIEDLDTSTDDFGLVSHVVGQGLPRFGTFTDIDWGSGPKFVEIILNTEGVGTQSIGNIQLWSVPYALFAETAGNAAGGGSKWLLGSGPPSLALGEANDLYLNTANNDYYQRQQTNWTLIGNLQGESGSPGLPGTMGETGAPGPAGPGITDITDNGNGTLTISIADGSSYQVTGLVGPAGERGEPGPEGPAGPRGDVGPTGEEGPPGDPGPAGPGISDITDNGNGTLTISVEDGSSYQVTGLVGPAGERGEPGPAGPRGDVGPTGEEGPPGDPGPAGPGISDITDNGNGTLTINVEDGSSYQVMGLVGPQGERGEPGPEGPAGPRGDLGPAGEEGPPGDPGPAGPGITDITDNGDGTLTIRVADGSSYQVMGLVGPQGQRGEPGPEGPTGPQGNEGPVGARGPAGDDGPTGPSGRDGSSWSNGDAMPDDGMGGEGDYYFRSNGDYFKKEGCCWAMQGQLDSNPGDDLTTATSFQGEVSGPATDLTVTALRGRPIGGMSPSGGQGYFMVINPETDEWEARQLGGEISGDFDSLEVVALRGRPIGGMPPSGGQGYFMVINPETDEWEARQLGGEISGDFDSLEVVALRGRPIGGMPPATGQSYFMVINPETDEWESKQLVGDITIDFDSVQVTALRGRPIGGMPPGAGQTLVVSENEQGELEWQNQDALAIPLQSGGSFSSAMLDLTNNDQSAIKVFAAEDHGIQTTTDRDNDFLPIGDIENDLNPSVQSAGIYSENANQNDGQDPIGVWGRVEVNANSNFGFGYGGIFESTYIGVLGLATGSARDAVGVYGKGNGVLSNGSNGFDWAGFFSGDVGITDDLTVNDAFSAGSKNFRIDHPLAPTEKYLFHSTIESPERKNIYDGIVTTDSEGFATVTLPAYFEALNTDFRYQLTVIGSFTQAIVKEKVHNNRFVIQTSEPHIEVSWQITGIRQDAYARANPLEVEVLKPAELQGTYLHPQAFGEDPTKAETRVNKREQ